MSALAATVTDNIAAYRYELLLDGELVGKLFYRTNDDVVTLIDTEVCSQMEGRGRTRSSSSHARQRDLSDPLTTPTEETRCELLP
jgi:hypothetical protein